MWNVNSLPARLDFVLDFLATHAPDIACLQELKVDDESFPHSAFVQAGYCVLTHGQPQWNGVAVLAKTSLGPPPSITQRGLPGSEAAGSRLLTVDAQGMSVTSVYVPNGKSLSHPDFKIKLGFLDDLITYARTLDLSKPTVLGGDFNLVPAALDSWNEAAFVDRIFHTKDERDRWSALLDLGFIDLFRAKHPVEQTFSWWDYRAGCFHKKQGLRIDFLIGTPDVASRVREAHIDREFRKKREGRIPSDHAPVLVDLD
jgi:exodeoxyribonuclease III